MIIHSVTPVELLMEQPQASSAAVMEIQGGYLEGHRTPQGFVTSRLISTDPALYLKNEYAPGSILPPGTH